MLWAAALGVMSLISGCAQPAGKALRFGLASAPITLDPRYATDATSARIDRLLYRRLVDFDAASRPVPSLAHWKLLSPTHYRFVLGGQGRRFTDGSRLTASDVKATYDYVLDPANASPHRGSLAMIDHITVVDPDTVDFYLKHRDPLFPSYLVIGILPAKAIAAKHEFSDHPIGSGPFRFVRWPSEGRLVLQRRSDGQRLEFIYVGDATVRVLKLLRGEIDMLQNNLPEELVHYLARQKGIRIQRRPGSNFSYIGFNLKDPALSHRDVRQAVAYAINRAAIVKYVLGGETRLAGGLLPPGHWAGNPQLTGYPYDPQRARALLKQAGYDRRHPLELTYKTSSDPFRIRIATIIQRQLEQVGIKVHLRSFDWATFYGDIKAGRFQMYSLTWVGIKSPDVFRYVFYSTSIPPKGANRGRYASNKADRLIDEAEQANDMAQRAAYYRQLQAWLLKTAPYVPLWYEEHFFICRQDVVGYHLAADGNYDGLINVRRVSRPAGPS
ncbi:MAG: ABC transporter substrate-binding protein [Gammaproteobacteria bacterium]